jgi:hypothetical protein
MYSALSDKYKKTITDALREKFQEELNDATFIREKKERQSSVKYMSFEMKQWNKDIIDCDFDHFLGDLLAAEPIDLGSHFYEALKEDEDLSTFPFRLSEDIWFKELFNGLVGGTGCEEAFRWTFNGLQETLKEIVWRKEEKKRIEEELRKEKEKERTTTRILDALRKKAILQLAEEFETQRKNNFHYEKESPFRDSETLRRKMRYFQPEIFEEEALLPLIEYRKIEFSQEFHDWVKINEEVPELEKHKWFVQLWEGLREQDVVEGHHWRFQALQFILAEQERREEESKKRIQEEKEKEGERMFPSTSIVTFTPLEDEYDW